MMKEGAPTSDKKEPESKRLGWKAGLIIFGIITVATIIYVDLTTGDYGIFGDRKYTIVVSGDSGITFTGAIMSMSRIGPNSMRSVEGTVPARYELSGQVSSCSFQKTCEKGRLTVNIQRNARSIGSAETSVAYGVATVAAR
jgi:hypothetical protein